MSVLLKLTNVPSQPYFSVVLCVVGWFRSTDDI
jgi:hypothetical protein